MTKQNLVQMTPEQAQQQYIESRKGEVRATTLQSQATPVQHFVDWLDANNKELHQLTGLDVQQFYDELNSRDYSRATLHHYMTAVRQFLLYLERVEIAPPSIADKVHRPVLEKGERKRDTEIEPDRVKEVVDWLDKFRYASRDHIVMLLLWRCGLRSGSLRSLDHTDVTQLDDGSPVLRLRHRPKKGTPLKNGVDGERPVNLSPEAAEAVQDYINNHRHSVRDEYGRKPLITSQNGRYSRDQIRKTVLQYTCPETTGIGSCSCDEERTKETAGKCEKSVSPHVIRAASITYWRSQDVPVDVVSDRMDVSRDVIEEHYDRRSKEGKAQQRRKYLTDI